MSWHNRPDLAPIGYHAKGVFVLSVSCGLWKADQLILWCIHQSVIDVNIEWIAEHKATRFLPSLWAGIPGYQPSRWPAAARLTGLPWPVGCPAVHCAPRAGRGGSAAVGRRGVSSPRAAWVEVQTLFSDRWPTQGRRDSGDDMTDRMNEQELYQLFERLQNCVDQMRVMQNLQEKEHHNLYRSIVKLDKQVRDWGWGQANGRLTWDVTNDSVTNIQWVKGQSQVKKLKTTNTVT